MRLASLNADTTSALDRPIWAALTSRQSHLGQAEGAACHYRSDVAPFATAGPAGEEDKEGLARLVARCPDGITLLQSGDIPSTLAGSPLEQMDGVQMLATRPVSAIPCTGLRPLRSSDVPEMLALVELAKPGPFRRNTLLMGEYFGIKLDGKLIAMAGERMKLPGFTEISAVCVHPGFRGRGFARCLTAHVAATIFERGEVPFLHAVALNTPAITLYRELGFEVRSRMQIAHFVAA